MANLIQRIFKSSAPAPSPSPQSNQNAEDAQSFNYQRFTNNVGYDLSQPRIDINARVRLFRLVLTTYTLST